MNEHEKWLKERTDAGATIDPAELPFIERLGNKDLSEADLSSCIESLEVLLSLDALLPLIDFVKDEERSMSLRRRAAQAISMIGSSYVETELRALLSSPSSELRLLAEIALGTKSAVT
jgi:HEAT repeat protein